MLSLHYGPILTFIHNYWKNHSFDFPGGSDDKEYACKAGDLGWEDPLEKEMATHSSILAWRIPWTEEATVHGVAKSQI